MEGTPPIEIPPAPDAPSDTTEVQQSDGEQAGAEPPPSAAQEAPETAAAEVAPPGDVSPNGAQPSAEATEPRLQDPGSGGDGAAWAGNGQAPPAPEAGESAPEPGDGSSAAGPDPAADEASTAESAEAGPAAQADSQEESKPGPAAGESPAAESGAAGAETGEPPPGDPVPPAPAEEAVPKQTDEAVIGKVIPPGKAGLRPAIDAELDRPRLPVAAEPLVRQQLSEWVEIAHRSRVPSLADRQGADGGDSISAAAVRATARLACAYVRPDTDEQIMADQLMRSLVCPPRISPAEIMQRYPTVTISKGQIRLDLARIEEKDNAAGPHFELLRLPGRLELRRADIAALAAGAGPDDATAVSDESLDPVPADEVPPNPVASNAVEPDGEAADSQAADAQAADAQAAAGTGADDSAEAVTGSSGAAVRRVAGTAAILWGPVGAIAAGSTYLSLDTIMVYARTQAFERVRDQQSTPEIAALGMRAVRALEIVVLVSAGMGGALWIDVDPADGEPVAVTAIDLTGDRGAYDMAARLR